MPKTARVPSLRHHRPSGRAVCTIGGKDIYCGRYGSPEAQAEYDRLIGEWLASGRTVSPASGDGSVSVAETLVAYLRFCETFYRPPSTEIERIRRALRPVAQQYGHTAACDFGPLALKAVREGLVAEGLSRRFINQLCGRIVRCWKWGCENEMVPPAVWQSLQAVRGLQAGRTAARETPRVLPVDDGVFEATVAAVNSPQVAAFLRLLRLTGARCGEICRMRCGEIDRTAEPWVYRPREHKTAHRGHAREVFIGPKAQAILTPWLRPDDPEAFVFSPRQALADRLEELKQPHRSDADRARAARNKRLAASRRRNGKPAHQRPPAEQYTPASIRQAVDRACKRAGMPHWHPHQLRHAAATELRRVAGLEAARVVLGHRSPAMADLYAEADRQAAADHMARHG